MDLEFSIRETTCRSSSGEDPATCDFQRGYYMVSVLGKAAAPEASARKRLVCFRDLFPSHAESLAAGWGVAALGALTGSTLCCPGGVSPSGSRLELWGPEWSWRII